MNIVETDSTKEYIYMSQTVTGFQSGGRHLRDQMLLCRADLAKRTLFLPFISKQDARPMQANNFFPAFHLWQIDAVALMLNSNLGDQLLAAVVQIVSLLWAAIRLQNWSLKGVISNVE